MKVACLYWIRNRAVAIGFTIYLLTVPVLGSVSVTTIFSFNGTNGTNPEGQLVQDNQGNLYGTTRDTTVKPANWGFHFFGYGTVFRITTNGTLTTLVRFQRTNGDAPRSGLVLGKDGNLYGTTVGGGANDAGTLFKLSTNDVFTSMASFYVTNGAHPIAALTLASDGSLYGTTVTGGARRNYQALGGGLENNGVVFELTQSGEIRIVLRFNGTNGSNPYTKVIQTKDRCLYGTTASDGLDKLSTNNPWGHGFGTIYKILPDGSEKTVVVFNGTNGGDPNALTMDNTGNLFGSTKTGGDAYCVTNDAYNGPTIIHGYGTVFTITKSGRLKTLVQFGGSNGMHPSELLLGRDGDFYGFTAEGGAFNHGTFFQLKPNGMFHTLHSFSGVKDDEGISTLMQAKDGNFYGVGVGSFLGGGESYYKCGRVFRLTINP